MLIGLHKRLSKQGRLMLVLFFVLEFNLVFSQVNYVGNPSFEVFHSGCSGPNFTSKLTYWNGIDSTTSFNGGLTYNSCYSNIPYNGPGIYQTPKTGNGMIRTTFYCSTVTCSYYSSRIYPKNRLLNTLISGNVYCVKMHVNLLNNMPNAIKELEILLSDGTIDTIKYCNMPLTFLVPQITNSTSIIGDTLNWVEIGGTFTATGTEKYLVIGNFKSDAMTTSSLTGVGVGIGSEYNIDDVSVIDFNLPAFAGPDKNINLGDSAFIGRPPEIGLECTWATGTTTIGTGGGLWVKPTSTGTFSYVVTQNICGNIKTDTVNINVNPGLVNENELFANSISVYPQPAKDVVTISLSNYYESKIEIKVYDLNGRMLRPSTSSGTAPSSISGTIPSPSQGTNYSSNTITEFTVQNGKVQLDTREFSNGVYVLQITNSKSQTVSKRLIIAN